MKAVVRVSVFLVLAAFIGTTPGVGPAASTAPSTTMEIPGPIGRAAPAVGSWIWTGGPLGGLGYDVRMRQDDPDTLLVTDAYTGVFRSTDGGAQWVASNTGITSRTGSTGDSIPIFCLTIDPHDADIVWAGTKDVRGVYRSADGGLTWVERDTGIVEDDGITFRGFTVDPRSSNIVYAAAELSSWVWAGQPLQGREFDRTAGVVYKTTDGGARWTAVWRGDNLARYIWIDPTAPDTVYVSTGIFDREAANSDPVSRTAGGVGVVKSTDGGQTWTAMTNGMDNLYVGSLFMHPTNPQVLLAGTGNNQYWEGAGVYRTTDGGATWQRTLTEEPNGIHSVEFATADPNIAYAAGTAAVYRSTDMGATWESVSPTWPGWGPPGIRAGFPIDIQVDPRDPNRVFVNNYGGGNFLSTDGGRTWMDASDGYTGAQVRDVSAVPGNPGWVYAASRSGLHSSGDGGNTWVGHRYPQEAVLEWNAVSVDPADPDHVLAASNWEGMLAQTTDGGRTWYVRLDLPEWVGVRDIEFAPSDTDVVYAAISGFASAGSFAATEPGHGVYRSNDGGATWTPANDATMTETNVVDVSVAGAYPGLVYAAVVERGLVRTTNGGVDWTVIGGLPTGAGVTAVEIHPTQPGIVLVGVDQNGVYRTTDGGATWKSASPGLNPEAVIVDFAFDPVDPSVVYAADVFGGVFRSIDTGRTWTGINTGLDTKAVNALSVTTDGLHVYAAVEGAGVYRLDLDGTPPPSVAIPQPDNASLDVTGLVDPTSGMWHLRDQDGNETRSFYFGNPGDVPFMGDWDCDGVDTPGLFRQSDAYAYLRNSNTQGIADIRFFFGNPSDIPLAGDFDGDGCDSLSIYRPSEQRFYVMNRLGENEGGLGAAEYSFVFGNPGDKPVVGDWDGDGVDEIGLHRESSGFFYYRDSLTQGNASGQFYFGDPGDRFVAGDWGIIDGADTPAVYRPGDTTFYFRHTLTQGTADATTTWGATPWIPVAGPIG